MHGGATCGCRETCPQGTIWKGAANTEVGHSTRHDFLFANAGGKQDRKADQLRQFALMQLKMR